MLDARVFFHFTQKGKKKKRFAMFAAQGGGRRGLSYKRRRHFSRFRHLFVGLGVLLAFLIR